MDEQWNTMDFLFGALTIIDLFIQILHLSSCDVKCYNKLKLFLSLQAGQHYI